MKISIMKHIFEQQPSPEISNGTSTSSLSRGDQEMGSDSLSRNGDFSRKRFGFICCISPGLDLNYARAVLAEMVGTFILMFSICGIIASTQLLKREVGLLEYASTAGLTVTVVVFCVGLISGAHVNPAITIALASFGHFPWSKVPLYILAQIVGSGFATYLGTSVYGVRSELMLTRPLQSCTSAFWVEFIATFIIMFLAASLTHHTQSQFCPLAGFIFGAVIALAVLITAPVSGGSMNPARSIGPAIISWNFDSIWVYISAPVLGAVTGASLFRLLRLECPPPSSTSPETGLLARAIRFGET